MIMFLLRYQDASMAAKMYILFCDAGYNVSIWPWAGITALHVGYKLKY